MHICSTPIEVVFVLTESNTVALAAFRIFSVNEINLKRYMITAILQWIIIENGDLGCVPFSESGFGLKNPDFRDSRQKMEHIRFEPKKTQIFRFRLKNGMRNPDS